MDHKEKSPAAKARENCPFLCTKEAAPYLGLSSRTLEKMRVSGRGPSFRKHGRYVRYHIDDLNAWSQASLSQSTSDKGGA